MRIHICGASGSGTTTLGNALAARFTCPHFDTDDYFWRPTEPPFQVARDRAERQTMLGEVLRNHGAWVLSGSLCGWGDIFIPTFQLVVFLLVPTEIRIARLQERERHRYGERSIAPDGSRHAAYTEFIDWARKYDEGDMQMRSRQLHEQWTRELPCPVLRLEGNQPVDQSLSRVIEFIS